jgi:hypothetical protein
VAKQIKFTAEKQNNRPMINIHHLNSWDTEKHGLAFLEPIIEHVIRRLNPPKENKPIY